MSNATLTITPPESVTTPRTEVNGREPKMLISMRNIWKTYQMGTEKCMRCTVSPLTFLVASISRSLVHQVPANRL